MERMATRIVRIVLSCIVFGGNAIAGKVQKEAGLVAEGILKEFVEPAFPNNRREGEVQADLKSVAALGRRFQK